ncbi:MAG: hypothetical protein HQM09_17640 [Candidatus Riflebacteria bacterium]|nr:hypothetical protein [Candidatus Riflebacteria bacterium]
MPIDHDSTESELLANIRKYHAEMVVHLAGIESSGLDLVRRFYSQSFFVYRLQCRTQGVIALLRRLAPAGTIFNPLFDEICREGADDKQFRLEYNENWSIYTRPIVEAFLHANFFLSAAVECGEKLDKPPKTPIPSAWAAIRELYIPERCLTPSCK